ncbi:hypothetical protein ACPCK3_14890 [Streptomyces griseoincarnatus]
MATNLSAAAAHVLRTAEQAVQREQAARDALTADLARGQAITGAMFQNVMDAAAAAAPWRDVLRLTDRTTVTDALREVRGKATRDLLEHGETISTSALTNEERRTRREGLRAFLWGTEAVMDALENEDTPTPAPTPEPTPAPVPAPAPAAKPTRASSGPRPTKAQRAVLELLATQTVIIRETGIGKARAYGPHGPVNITSVRAVISNRWARLDTSTSLYTGQAVTLTPEGRAHLPS